MGLSAPAAAQTFFEDSIVSFHGDFEYSSDTRSVSFWDDFIATGDPHTWGMESGFVNIFDNQTGGFLRSLYSENGNGNDGFGVSVDIQDGMVLVGASTDDTFGSAVGAAYLFDIQTGDRLHVLFPNIGAPFDNFGSQVLIHDGMAIVSAPGNDTQGNNYGAIYFFDLESGEQISVLYPDENAGGSFGKTELAMDAGVLAVGARRDSIEGANVVGSVFLFDVESGTQMYRVNSEDFQTFQWFGESLSLGQGVLAVSARGDSQNGSYAGATYLFDVSSGVQLAKVLPTDGAAGSRFGTSVYLANGLLAVGAEDHFENGVETGAAYVFDAEDGHQIAKLISSNGDSGHEFGAFVFIDQRKIYISAPKAPASGLGGTVYVYDQSCAPDLNFDGITDFFDVSEFIQLYRANDLAADFVPDGQLDFFDIGAFIGSYASGCP